jgi:hypothetical protein
MVIFNLGVVVLILKIAKLSHLDHAHAFAVVQHMGGED